MIKYRQVLRSAGYSTSILSHFPDFLQLIPAKAEIFWGTNYLVVSCGHFFTPAKTGIFENHDMQFQAASVFPALPLAPKGEGLRYSPHGEIGEKAPSNSPKGEGIGCCVIPVACNPFLRRQESFWVVTGVPVFNRNKFFDHEFYCPSRRDFIFVLTQKRNKKD